MPPVAAKRILPRPRRWFALLVVLGMLALSLPLAEAWRRQGLELQTAVEARRALGASALVVRTQRALAAHRPLAAAVLAGHGEREAERRRGQHAVDGEVGQLVGMLESQRLQRALDEVDQLRLDWSSLLEAIGGRRIAAAASDTAHDLLVEQTFVVLDLVGAAAALPGQVGRAFTADEWQLALHTLPRLALALAAAPDAETALATSLPRAPGGDTSLRTHARRAAKAAAEVLRAADAAAAASPDEPAPDADFVRALVALQQHAAPLAGASNGSAAAATSPTSPTSPTSVTSAMVAAAATAAADHAALQRARASAIEAQRALMARLDSRLAGAAAALQAERRAFAAAGFLALLIGALAAMRVLPRRAADADVCEAPAGIEALDDRAGCAASADGARPADGAEAGGATVAAGAESHRPAVDLLERLRHPGHESDADVHLGADAGTDASAHPGTRTARAADGGAPEDPDRATASRPPAPR